MKLIIQKPTGSIVDRIFTKFVAAAQITAVQLKVKKKTKLHLNRKGPLASEDFTQKLEKIGITPEQLWWGPMTLFPRKAEFLLNEIEKNKPKRVLEIGAGTSTALLTALGQKHNFSVFSIENFDGTVDYINSLLTGLPHTDNLTIQKCGFISRKYPTGEKYRWYDADLTIANCKFDFVLIDGPVGSLVGRNGAIPQIFEFLEKECVIYVDDYNREHEKECVREWQKHYPNLTVEEPSDCEGIGRLKFK